MPETKNFFGIIRMPFRVCDVNIKQVPQGTWGLFAINRGSYSNERYKIYVLLDDTTIYMKPSQPYYSKEFEDLFGFSIECSEYDSDKVIMVKDPMYYKQFVDYFSN